MILECEYCFNRIDIRVEDSEVKILFCPHCGEPTNEEKEDNELGFKYYDD